MSLDIKAKIDLLKDSKSADDRKECIPLLQAYLEKNPNDPLAWYDLAGCYDFCGLEADAEPCYRQTYELDWKQIGTSEQPGFFVGFGSTLRNNLKFDESESVLKDAISHFPTYPALKVFLAFTQYSLELYKECAETLFAAQLEMPPQSLDGYEKPAKWYVENLQTFPPKPEKSKLSPAIPQLPSGDLEKTAQFFEKILGFEIVNKMIEHGFLSVRRGPAEIHFWRTADEQHAQKLGSESSCYIRVENIDLLFKEFKERGAIFRYELKLQPWGMNEMQIDDPFLNAIRFGEEHK